MMYLYFHVNYSREIELTNLGNLDAFGPEASIITVILGTFLTLIFLRNRYRR